MAPIVLNDKDMIWWLLSACAHDPIHDCNKGRLADTFEQMHAVLLDLVKASEGTVAGRGGGRHTGQKGGQRSTPDDILKKAFPYLITISIEYIQKILLLFSLEFPDVERKYRENWLPAQQVIAASTPAMLAHLQLAQQGHAQPHPRHGEVRNNPYNLPNDKGTIALLARETYDKFCVRWPVFVRDPFNMQIPFSPEANGPKVGWWNPSETREAAYSIDFPQISDDFFDIMFIQSGAIVTDPSSPQNTFGSQTLIKTCYALSDPDTMWNVWGPNTGSIMKELIRFLIIKFFDTRENINVLFGVEQLPSPPEIFGKKLRTKKTFLSKKVKQHSDY